MQSTFSRITRSPRGVQLLDEAFCNLLRSPDAKVRLRTAESLAVTLELGEVRLDDVPSTNLYMILVSLLRPVAFHVHVPKVGIDSHTVIAQDLSPSLRPGACLVSQDPKKGRKHSWIQTCLTPCINSSNHALQKAVPTQPKFSGRWPCMTSG